MTSLYDALLVSGAISSAHPVLFPYQADFLGESIFLTVRKDAERRKLRGREGVVIIDDYEKPAGQQLPRLLACLMARIS